MRLIYLFPLFLSLLSFHANGSMKRILLKWDDSMIAEKGYRGEVFQVGAEKQLSVYQFETTNTQQIWKSELDGFFLLRVSPLDNKKMVVAEEIQEKKLFISNPPKELKPLLQYLCEDQYSYDWKKGVGKSKFLIRLNDLSSGRVVYQKLSRSNSVHFERLLFKKNHLYHFTVIESRVGGEVRLKVNRYLEFRSCSDQPLKVLAPLNQMRATAYYTPRYSMHKQVGDCSTSTNQLSYISFGADFESPRQGKSSYWGKIDYHNYSKAAGSLAIEELSAEAIYKRYMGQNWTLLAGIEYEDFGSFNDEASSKTGALLEDRHRLLYGELGFSKLLWPMGKRLELKLILGYSLYSTTTFGDKNSSNKSLYAGQKLKLINDLYLTPSFFVKGGLEGRVLSGNDSYTRFDLIIGPGLSF